MDIAEFAPKVVTVDCTWDRKGDTKLLRLKLINEVNRLEKAQEKLNKIINAPSVCMNVDEYCEIGGMIERIENAIKNHSKTLHDIENGWVV